MLDVGQVHNGIRGGVVRTTCQTSTARPVANGVVSRLLSRVFTSLLLLFSFSPFLLFFPARFAQAQEAAGTTSHSRQQEGTGNREQGTAGTQSAIENRKSKIENSSTLEVTGEGLAAFNGDVAAAQEEAVWDAKRNAVEQAVGFFLKSKTTARNFGVEEDEIVSKSEGFVRRWEVVEGSRRIETVPGGNGNGKPAQVLHIEVRATVELISLLHHLSDAADLYKDLERPRLRVQIRGKKEQAAIATRIQRELAGALQAQGFEVASEGAAEVVLNGVLDVVPTVSIGDKDAPYGVGESVAACRVRLNMQAVSSVSEDVLFAPSAEASGRSFQSNEDAINDAVTQICDSAIGDSEKTFVPALLARWARERQEGYVVALKVEGLTSAECERLKQTLADMRGFRRFVEEQRASRQTTLRFLTRRDTRSLRRDLSQFALSAASASRPESASRSASASRKDQGTPRPPSLALTLKGGRTEPSAPVSAYLRVLNDRGPTILCAAHTSTTK